MYEAFGPGSRTRFAIREISVNLSSDELPQPRLKPVGGTVMVPFYTDFRVHDTAQDGRASEARSVIRFAASALQHTLP